MIKTVGFFVLILVVALSSGFSNSPYPGYSGSAKSKIDYSLRPIVFVHGSSGSGAQFQSQAMRFTSNGYPPNYIESHEYDSSTVSVGQTERFDRLDKLIDKLLQESGAKQIDLLGHSLGTFEMITYMNSSPERAAKVAHYVNIDGRTSDSPPGGVPTLALWAELGLIPDGKIAGAKNVVIPDQTHIEVATSKESFVEMYRFFNDKDPFTNEVVPEPPGQVRLAGKASLFPQNVTPENAKVEIYEVNGDTGKRVKKKPEAVYSIESDGSWGPFKAKGGQHYEFVIVRDGAANHHFYFEPFIRSDYMIRLLTSPPTGGLSDLMDKSDSHSSLVIQRNKEFLGTGNATDTLAINGINIVNENNSPISKRISSYFVFDKGSDKKNNITQPIPAFHALPFLTGVDLYVPASNPPNSTITLELSARNSNGKNQVINVPNWASTGDRITVQFNDFVQ